MTAQSADRAIVRREGETFSFPVAANVTCYQGAIAVLDSAGRVKPGVAATGLIPVGIFTEKQTNGAVAGAVNASVMPGIWRFANSGSGDAITSAEIGDACYIVDDQTVAKTDDAGARSAAGQIVAVDTVGVWVRIGMDFVYTVGLLAANNLSDVASKATARTNLGGGANKIVLTLPAVSTKGSDAAVTRIVSPVAGTIDKVWSVLNAALATGDATLTGKIGATAITDGEITITEAGSAAGDVDSVTPSAKHTVAVGNVISFTGGGTSSAASTATISLLITPTA